jgi:hypothetical protein
LLEQLTELRQHFTHTHSFIIKDITKDRDKQPDRRDKQGKDVGRDAELPCPLSRYHTLQEPPYVQLSRNLSKLCPSVVLLRLHDIGRIVYITDHR